MTTYEWTMVCIASGGFTITVGGTLAGCVWGVAKIKQYTVEQIAAEQLIRAKTIADVAKTFAEDQKTQDHNMGEMGSALRRFIEAVEKEMHQIEIWGRDHYALKNDVEKSTNALLMYVKEMRTEIKADLLNLGVKLDARH